MTEVALWTTQDGRVMKVCDMTDSHLLNTVRYFIRSGNFEKKAKMLELTIKKEELKLEFYQKEFGIDDEPLDLKIRWFYQQLKKLEALRGHVETVLPAIAREMLREIKRRKIELSEAEMPMIMVFDDNYFNPKPLRTIMKKLEVIERPAIQGRIRRQFGKESEV